MPAQSLLQDSQVLWPPLPSPKPSSFPDHFLVPSHCLVFSSSRETD